MDAVIGLIELLAIAAVVIGIRQRRAGRRTGSTGGAPPSRPAAPPARPGAGQRTPPATAAPGPDRRIEGWLIGHEVRHGHRNFPGDPLPGGHLGSARDAAFWGSTFDDDDPDGDDPDGGDPEGGDPEGGGADSDDW